MEATNDMEITLTINLEQASWLKLMCQNAHCEYESNEHERIRKYFWDSLPGLEELEKQLSIKKEDPSWHFKLKEQS